MALHDFGESAGATGIQAIVTRQIVTFKVDERTFGIDVGTVREIKGWQATTPLPHAAPYVRGVINLRGVILAVYDLRNRIGLGRTEAQSTHVIVVVDVGEQAAGLLVDAVSDIVDIPVSAIRPAPAVAMDGLDLIEGMAILANDVVALLRLQSIVAEDLPPNAAALTAAA
jgi:purine-binding chemotaxis protein CheW